MLNLRLVFITVISLVGCNAIAENIHPEVPMDVVGVERHVINKNLIRIIQFNTESTPKFVIERLSRPSTHVLEKLVITKLSAGDHVLDFNDTAGVFIENIKTDKTSVKFSVYFVYSGKGGGSVDLQCSVKVGDKKLHEPTCDKVPTTME